MGKKKIARTGSHTIPYREFSDIVLAEIEKIIDYNHFDDVEISREDLEIFLEPLYNSLLHNRTTTYDMKKYAEDYGKDLGKELKKRLERTYQRNLDGKVA